MVRFLSKALSALTLRKRGAKTLKHRRPAKPKNAQPPTDTVPATDKPDEVIETIESLEEELVESPLSALKEPAEPVPTPVKAPEPVGARPMTPDRRALIREAMAVQRTKSKLLDELNPEQRRKLRVLAGKMLLGE